MMRMSLNGGSLLCVWDGNEDEEEMKERLEKGEIIKSTRANGHKTVRSQIT